MKLMNTREALGTGTQQMLKMCSILRCCHAYKAPLSRHEDEVPEGWARHKPEDPDSCSSLEGGSENVSYSVVSNILLPQGL